MALLKQDFINAANLLGCTTAAIQAVAYVEGGQIGFWPSGKTVIKFEGHVFSRLTGRKYDQSHPTLSYRSWTEKYSQSGDDAYIRFNQAFALDPKAAMMATSWGMFQIMGENFRSAGFKTVDDFVTAMRKSEYNQLVAFCNIVKNFGLVIHLKRMATDTLNAATGFARIYNGAQYAKNSYHKKIYNAYVLFR